MQSEGAFTTEKSLKCLEVGYHESGSFGDHQQNQTQISREGFVREYLSILSVLLIERNTEFIGVMIKKQRLFLTAFKEVICCCFAHRSPPFSSTRQS
jgi:hypothetical protein